MSDDIQNQIFSSSLSALLNAEAPKNLDTLENKKKLLQEKILDKNFDTANFVEFCYSKKSNGDDLNQWTYEELNEIIDEYVRTKGTKGREEGKSYRGKMGESVSGRVYNPSLSLQNNPISIISPIPLSKSKEEHKITCLKLPNSLLSEKKVTVSLRDPHIVETSMFQMNYVLYEVYTDVTGWHVSRRYSDFTWLRSCLKKQFPHVLVPMLPNKKYGGRRFEGDFIDKRRYFLEVFINSIVKNEDFKSSDALLSFLFISNRDHFEAKMKEISSALTNSHNLFNIVENYSNSKGYLFILEDPEEISKKDNYYKNVENYFKVQNQILLQ